MARWESSSPYVNIDFNVGGLSLSGDWPNITFHFDCNFNYYCTSGYASMNYNGVNFNTQVTGYNTETKSDNVNFYITGGQESPRYGGNYYNPRLENSRQRTVDVHAWVSNGIFTGGGWTTVTSPQIGDPSGLSLSITNVTENSCVVTHRFTNNRNYWYVRLWDRNTRTYYNLNNNTGSGTTTITGLSPNTEYRFELWACGRDGNEYGGSYPGQTIRTLGKSSIGNTPAYTIGNSFNLMINGYSDAFTHQVAFTIGNYSFSRNNLKRGTVTITPTAAENTAIYAQMKTVSSKSMSISLTTYVGASAIGTNTGTGNVSVNAALCSPIVTSFLYKDVNEVSKRLTGNDQYVIQNVSKLQIYDIAAAPRNSASLAKYRIEVSDTNYESSTSSIQTGVITASSTLNLKVIDSRGLQGTLSKNYLQFIPYSAPIIKECSVVRKNHIEASSTLDVKATYALIMVDEVQKNNITSLSYRYKATTSATWSSFIQLIPNVIGEEISFHSVIGDFDVDTSFNFEIQISDEVNTATASTILVVGKPTLSIRENSVGINQTPDLNYALDVKGNIRSDEGFYKGTAYLQPMTKVNGYWGFPEIGDYLRTPASGLLPYQSGGSSYLGTSSWPFNYGYFNSLYKGGVIVPNSNEVPLMTTENNWYCFKFPSGLMIQNITYSADVNVNIGYGSGYFGYVPAPSNYPTPFTTLINNQVTMVDNDISSIVLWSPTTVNFSGGSTFYAYCYRSIRKTIKLHCTAYGRWK